MVEQNGKHLLAMYLQFRGDGAGYWQAMNYSLDWGSGMERLQVRVPLWGQSPPVPFLLTLRVVSLASRLDPAKHRGLACCKASASSRTHGSEEEEEEKMSFAKLCCSCAGVWWLMTWFGWVMQLLYVASFSPSLSLSLGSNPRFPPASIKGNPGKSDGDDDCRLFATGVLLLCKQALC